MDVSTVKAEIKSWEYEFRSQNGRSATVEDIKAIPMIAEKYKLYKKLTKQSGNSKGKTNSSQTQVPEPPQTPPSRARSREHAQPNASTAAILPKSRPIASSPEAATKNPFSPAKKTLPDYTRPSTTINPFLTPVKSKRSRSQSFNLPIQQDVPQHVSQQTAAIMRARKRLRGESVSPSPLPREKRRRATGLDPPAQDRLSQARSSSPLDEPAEEGDSFMDDSPVKAPAGGRSFKPLFEEAMPLSQPLVAKGDKLTTRGRTFSRAKTLPNGLFGAPKKNIQGVQGTERSHNTASDLSGDESALKTVRVANLNEGGKRAGKNAGKSDGAQIVKRKKLLPGPKGLIPGKDDLFENPPVASSSIAGISRKRTLSRVAEDENKDRGLKPKGSSLGLLPPSPPPQDHDAGRYNFKGKGKEVVRDSRKRSKKAKLSVANQEDDEDVEDDMSDGVGVKITAWRGRPQSPHPDDEDSLAFSVDPELQQFHLRPPDSGTHPASPPPEKFEVDLPEEMRRVLALSSHRPEWEKEEEDLVKGLIRGQRRGRGVVWGPGEVGGESEVSDEGIVGRAEDDDWEGEGVPWEIAEL